MTRLQLIQNVATILRPIRSHCIKRQAIRGLSTGIEEQQTGDDEEHAVLRLKQEDSAIKETLKQWRAAPESEWRQVLESRSSGNSSERERELEEKLTQFLLRYSQNNSILSPPEIENPILNSPTVSSEMSWPYLVPSHIDKPYNSQELYLRRLQHSRHGAKLGANITNVYSPNRDIYKPEMPEEMTVEKLMAAGVHLGQSTSLWRPSTQPYIYGAYRGIHIIDPTKTLAHLKRACRVVEGVAARGGAILFVGTRQGQKPGLTAAANRTRGYYVSSRWIPGTLTNPVEISGVWERHEVDMLDKPTNRKLGPNDAERISKPDLVIVLNPTENRNALREAIKCRVPTIGIIDTDSEPSLVTYPIPGNDDSLRSVNLILGVLSRAGERGIAQRLNKFNSTAE